MRIGPTPEATLLQGGRESRSAVSVGLEWGSRVTTIGLEFALPAVLGRGVDVWLGTAPWLTVAGAVLGLTVGMIHVLRLPGEIARAEERRRPPRSGGAAERADDQARGDDDAGASPAQRH